MEKELFLIHKYLTDKFPASHNILLCSKYTSNEEITAFLYRAILCEFNSCFIIGRIESLESDKKENILTILNKLIIVKKEKMKSCLIILYTNNSTDIYKSLSSLNYAKNLPLQLKDFSKNKISKKESNIEIISSDKSGAGKSTKIKLEIENQNKNYIYFPFGGEINRKDIINRLNDLSSKISDPKKYAIHFDLHDTEQIDLMSEFLFSILITRLYGHDDKIIYFPKELEIKIEIPNGFVDFINKFPILDLFEKTYLSLKNLPSLNVPLNINSNVQIVANYLKLLKEKRLDDVDLFFEDLTPQDFLSYSTLQKAAVLSQEEC